jgi:uncharacterized protein YcgI (DUF1989 family)
MIAFSFVAQGWKQLEPVGGKILGRVVDFLGKQVSHFQVLRISDPAETGRPFIQAQSTKAMPQGLKPG